MIWIIIYLIGMGITLIEITIAAIRENLFSGLTPGINITIAFFSLILWPVFHIMIIMKWITITNGRK